MSGSSVLFQWLDINWTPTKCLAVAGLLLMLVGAALFIGLFKHLKGKAQRMTPVWGGPAGGVKVEIRCNIDTLRRAARRGDWLTFWLWPSMLSCWFIGVCLIFLAVLPRDPLLIVLVLLVPALMVFVAWFMPWAAIYTNIDLNANAGPPAADDRTQPPQRSSNGGPAARSRPSLEPRLSRVALFFIGSFGFVGVPFALVALDMAFAPTPFIIHTEALPRDGSSIQHFDDGSTVTVLVRSSNEAAKLEVERIVRTTPTRSFSQTNGNVAVSRFYNAMTGRAFAWLRVGQVAVGIEAADRAAVDQRLANLTVITKNPRIDPLFEFAELCEHAIGKVLLGIGVYMLAMAYFMLRAASWAGRIDPAPGTPVVTADALRSRLLEVNHLGLPWRLEELRPGVLRAEWVYADARWLHVQGAGQIRTVRRLTLRLDHNRRRVSVIESDRSLSWGAGFAGLFANFSYWRGITFFAYETGVAVGLGFHDGKWELAEAYRYRFSATEMRNPLVEAIVDGGWSYAPSLTLIRWLGG